MARRLRLVACATAASLVLTVGVATLGPAAGAATASQFGTAVPTTSRIAGADREGTAVAISQHAYPQPFQQGGSVYLARQDVFADAMAAGTLTDGPVLLVPSCGPAPAIVVDEVARLKPARVVALGGEGAVCSQLLTAVAAGRPVARLAGADRYATSVEIAYERRRQAPASETYLANGDDGPDAVVGGQLTRGPILLTSAAGLPDVVRQYLSGQSGPVLALGGTSVVPADQLAAANAVRTGRMAGPSRYETAAAIVAWQFPADADSVYLARGDLYADAVASGALSDGPVVLVGRCSLPAGARERIAAARPLRIYALGGPGAVCDGVLADAAQAASVGGGRSEVLHRDPAGFPLAVNPAYADLSGDGRYLVWALDREQAVGAGSVKGVWFRDLSTTQVDSRVDIAPTGESISGYGTAPSISDDGRRVAFIGAMVDPVTGQHFEQVFVRDLSTGVTTRLTRAPDGQLAHGNAGPPQISDDGSTVVFGSTASDLVSGDTNGSMDVFAVDVASLQTSLVSRGQAGVPANGASTSPVVSGDGRVVAYSTTATNIADVSAASGTSILASDRLTGVATVASVDGTGVSVPIPSQRPSISSDGRVVGFVSDNGSGQELRLTSLASGTSVLASRDASGGPLPATAGMISPDGGSVTFTTAASGHLPGEGLEWYRRDLTSGAVNWLTPGLSGEVLDAPTTVLAMSADGRRILLREEYARFFGLDGTLSQSLHLWELLVPR